MNLKTKVIIVGIIDLLLLFVLHLNLLSLLLGSVVGMLICSVKIEKSIKKKEK